MKTAAVIGAGLAGAEAAHALAACGIHVRLFEMKPAKFSPAHKNENFAELVCSNSFKAFRENSAPGMLKAEMRLLGSATLRAAERCTVPAGGALAVDRVAFSAEVTRQLRENPLIEIVSGTECDTFPEENTVIATGPLTSDVFACAIQAKIGDNFLHFFDAAAPVITAESIDREIALAASRYGKGDADYLNCPMSATQYDVFYHELINAETAVLHEFEKGDIYEGCMPVEVLAKRGKDSIRFGPLKPVGLTETFEDRTGSRPAAIVQLRAENDPPTMYNLVGFQTNLKFREQERVFRLIPGLQDAEFVRYGVMHRNTFLNSPKLLTDNYRLKNSRNIFFAGQITGVEGYMESAGSGIVAGLALAAAISGKEMPPLPKTTMLGCLSDYAANFSGKDFQPMGANMGLLPEITLSAGRRVAKQEKYRFLSERGLSDLREFISAYINR
ncbi:FADH(2)-oxidizing methylenetetrahydrofolate--tRNA-(uracil(54)-C(5))-methyltransferase TrmFO [Clostridia bacterium]|nr:FADH(2)-oxidizing methylenetetrahydrofolate--tRNA-(uracil(54)-C(5))-methyltransferase TrmFO [Clostridia bacterium]